MTCPRGEFGPAGRVGRRHRLAAAVGGARPGHPPFRYPCLVGHARATPESLTCSGARDPGAEDLADPGVCDMVGHARAQQGVCPWYRSGQPGRPPGHVLRSRGVRLGRVPGPARSGVCA